LRKLSLLLFTVLLLSGCNSSEGGQKTGNETIDKVDETDEKVEAAPNVKGFITIDGTEHELILNEKGLESYELSEFAEQFTPIIVKPEEIATIRIDNDPYFTVSNWGNEVPVESDIFKIPYETGRYIFSINAHWPNDKTHFFTVIEVPYEFKRVKRDTEPNDPNPWIKSPDGDRKVLLEGYGEFESVGTIVLRDLKNNTLENIDFNHGRQWTPKKIDWYDNDSLLMIIGYTHGTVTRGGDVFHLDLNSLELTPVIELPDREEVSDFTKEGKHLYYEMFVHDEDYNSGHYETRTLDLGTVFPSE